MRRVLGAIERRRDVRRGPVVAWCINQRFVEVCNRGDLWITSLGRVALAEEWTRDE